MMRNQSVRFRGTCYALAGALLFAGANVMSAEQPEYDVIATDGDVEYRQYEPYLVAETVVVGPESYKKGGNEGFKRLFKYITGANSGGEKVSMTAPVAQGATGEQIDMTTPVQRDVSPEGWRVAFMLPSRYDLATAPEPTDPRVRIRPVRGRLMAAVRSSGRWTEKNFRRQSDKLTSQLAGRGINQLNEIQVAVYDPPYKLPFLRRNEVMVEVDRVPALVAVVMQGDRVAE
jgi:hypothetical protein